MDNKWMYLIATALIIFFLFSFILPLFSITKHITIDSFKDVLFSKRFVQVFTNSFKVSIASMILSILIAYLAAYAINNTKIPYKNLFSAFFILPIMVPTISIGYGLVNIFGRNGAFTRLTSIDINIYGPVGIIIGTALHSFPVAYLILSNAMKLYDNSVYESAEILGLSSFKVFSKITFPFLSRPLISAAISVFLLAFTDYGIPLMVGGRYTTISIFLYREVVGLLNFSKGSSLAIILLTLAFFLFLFEVFNKSYDVSDSVYTGLIVKENKIRDIICGTILVLLILLITVLFGSFLIVSFINNFPNDWTFTLKHVNQALKRGALTALKNSIFISLLSSCCGAVIAYLASYVAARIKNEFLSKLIYTMSTILIVIPGLVLGLGYMFYYTGKKIYGTIYILCLANITHYFTTPFLTVYNTMKKINPNFEDVCKTLSIPQWKYFFRVLLPLTYNSIIDIMLYLFTNSMVTLTAVVFLFNTKTIPLSVMLNLFESNMLYESAAFITLIILVINLSLRYITYLYRKTELLAVNSIRGIDGSSCQKSSPGMSLKRNTPHFLRKAVKALRPSR